MKEFFSNAWVISITSGILVFIITSIFLMLLDKTQHKQKIRDANIAIINHMRGYVVDNGFPANEIIEAVKASVARKYGVKNEEILATKEICEELISEIIGNIYIYQIKTKYPI